jgi:hypothetical protein
MELSENNIDTPKTRITKVKHSKENIPKDSTNAQRYEGIIQDITRHGKNVTDISIRTEEGSLKTHYDGFCIPQQYLKCGDKIELYANRVDIENILEQIFYLRNKTRRVAFLLEEIAEEKSA